MTAREPPRTGVPLDDSLDDALAATFPASDPVAIGGILPSDPTPFGSLLRAAPNRNRECNPRLRSVRAQPSTSLSINPAQKESN